MNEKWHSKPLEEKDLESLTAASKDPEKCRTWFEGQAEKWFGDQTETNKVYLLAHADDGVIWGWVEDGQMKLAGEAFEEVKVTLRAVTLQQARLFGPAGELLVWRGEEEGGWNGRYLSDNGIVNEDMFDETHRLWGTASNQTGKIDGFTLMQEGVQGLLHAPPLKLAPNTRAALKVRHYLAYDEQGQAYVALSRLVTVKEGGK